MKSDLEHDFRLESLKLDGAKPRVDTACEKCVYGSGEHTYWCSTNPDPIYFTKLSSIEIDWEPGEIERINDEFRHRFQVEVKVTQ